MITYSLCSGTQLPNLYAACRINSYEELVEEIARYEHLQWVEWSKAIAESETISPERLARWKKLWVPYSRLPEEEKESDRKYARKVLKHLFKQRFITVNAYPVNRVSGSTYDTEKRGGYETAETVVSGSEKC